MKKILSFISLICLVFAVSGCTSKVSKSIPADGVLAYDEVTFPALDKAWLDPFYPSKEAVAKLELGMSKDEIATLIGYPRFQEGFFYVREWDYVFNMKEKAGDPDKICQFKVVFDDNITAGSMHWKPQDCGPSRQSRPEIFELESDFLFDFAKSSLKPAGKAKIADISSRIDSANLKNIEILGYTDPVGSEASNLTLSQKRADSVKREFIANGIDARKITSSGLGESKQVKICDQNQARASYIECLAPNRRVVITVNGVK